MTAHYERKGLRRGLVVLGIFFLLGIVAWAVPTAVEAINATESVRAVSEWAAKSVAELKVWELILIVVGVTLLTSSR